MHEEHQYLNLIDNILKNGTWEEGRNGKTKSIFGSMMRFSLKDGKIPILTTKKTAWKTCLKELLWFIRGETDNKLLQSQNVHIWDGNTTREFLDSRGLHHYREGLIGPGYGWQWRRFNTKYDVSNEGTVTVSDSDIDQLQQIIDALKDPAQRTSRRLVMSAWNPCQLNEMALPPCHILCQFNVHDGNKLSCSMFQRSNDEACGTTINIASYSFLTHLLAKHCGLEAYEFVYFTPYPFPTVSIKELRENISDYTVDDFVLENYQHHEPIKFQMVA